LWRRPYLFPIVPADAPDDAAAPGLLIRAAEEPDAAAVAAIHNEGIEDRVATFQTQVQSAETAVARMGRGSLLVAERGGEVLGWGGLGPYEHYSYYETVAEVTVYVSRAARGAGIGGSLLNALDRAGEERGMHKLVAKIFSDNEASIALFARAGYREVGVHRRHGRLDGDWRDVVVFEKLLGDAATS
jgi:L-amino acid N-acyltransferase YncA